MMRDFFVLSIYNSIEHRCVTHLYSIPLLNFYRSVDNKIQAAICSLFYYIYKMKTILLSICLFFAINSFSQKVTYSDLIGKTWVDTNNRVGINTVTKFIDSSHYMLWSFICYGVQFGGKIIR